MTVDTEFRETAGDQSSSPRVRIRMLGQMADALEDQIAALYRRAAAFEEEEFLLNREVEERQTEINRLTLKLDAMRAERDRVTERIETISREVAAMREEVFEGEAEVAIASIGAPTESRHEGSHAVFTDVDPSRGAIFFRRMTLAEHIPQV